MTIVLIIALTVSLFAFVAVAALGLLQLPSVNGIEQNRGRIKSGVLCTKLSG